MLGIMLAAAMGASSAPDPFVICEFPLQQMMYNRVEEEQGHFLRTPQQIIDSWNKGFTQMMLTYEIPPTDWHDWRILCRGYREVYLERAVRESIGKSNQRVAQREQRQ